MDISRNLYKHLESELNQLYVRREKLKDEFSEALELGDEVENAPLDAATQGIEMNEPRIASLETLLRQASPIDDVASATIILGSLFVAIPGGASSAIELILTNIELSSFLPSKLRALSSSTPLGQAALGTKVGETFTAVTPTGSKSYKVISLKNY